MMHVHVMSLSSEEGKDRWREYYFWYQKDILFSKVETKM